jgi:hypothetical protein
VVSVTEKAYLIRQVRTEKANVSEPLMKCRKRSDGIKTRVQLLPWDESGGCLCYWPGGVRHEGGASSVQALVWNVGTPRPDTAGPVLDWPARGRTPSSGNCEGQSTDAGRRADRPVVVMTPGNAGRAKGTGCPGLFDDQPAWSGGVG